MLTGAKRQTSKAAGTRTACCAIGARVLWATMAAVYPHPERCKSNKNRLGSEGSVV
jgi:hypothetical protein